jgi:hypothetical protein
VRILLDENLPVDLAGELTGHEVTSVTGLGWKGVKNGELLRRAEGRFEVSVTMDRNLEFQQNVAAFRVAVSVLVAQSNRIVHLQPLIPAILTNLRTARLGELRRIGV